MQYEALNPSTGKFQSYPTKGAALSAMHPGPARQPDAPVGVAWPNPLPLGDDLPAVPALDLELLPAAFRGFVEDVSELMQTPVDYAAAACLVSLAGCVNRRAAILPKREDTSWKVIPNLWGAIIAPPGMMKSPVLHVVTRPLAQIEEGWRIKFSSECSAFELEREKADLRWQGWREDYKRAAKKASNLPVEPDRTLAQPRQRRLILTDATFEKLHEILAENGSGVLVVRDELTGWLASLDRQGREGERGFYLQSWNGDAAFTIDRIGRGSIHVEACCVSLIGLIQPARLRWYLAQALEGGPTDDGLIQRFQIAVWPDPPHEWRLVDRPPNESANRTASAVFDRLAALDSENPVTLRFVPDAQELFFAWWAELERAIRSDSLAPALASHLAKYRSLMPTIAGLFELADAAAENDGPSREALISLEHTQQAAAWTEYLAAHARRIYSCAISPELRAVRDLAAKIKNGILLDGFTTRSVYLRGWSGLDTPERGRAALALIEDAGWIRRDSQAPSESGGRPSERWVINPKVLHA